MDVLSASSAEAPTINSASVPAAEEISGTKGEGLASGADLAS